MNVKEVTSVGLTDLGLLRNNLRLPENFDNALLAQLWETALLHVEKHSGYALRAKTMVLTFFKQKNYPLLYVPTLPVVVKRNGTATTDFEYYPNYVRMTVDLMDDEIIQVEYAVPAETNVRILNVAIMYASALYNNPEGIPEPDLKRINNFLTSMSR